MATLFPNVPISQQSSRTTSRNLNMVSFGDGYEQRTPMGINYKRDKWNIVWDALNTTNKTLVINFIDAISNGSIALWTPPGEVAQKKFVLDGDWTLSNKGGNVYAIQLSLRQVFDL